MINLASFKINVTVSVWLKLAGYTAAILVFLSLYYHFTVSNYTRKLSSFQGRIKAVNVKYLQYENFGAFKERTEQNKQKIVQVLSGYEDIFSGAQKSQNTFLDRISEISVQAKINLDKITPDESTGKKNWNVNFTSDYKGICDFFALLEKYFKVESFAVTSGEFRPMHLAQIIVSGTAVAPAATAPDVSGRDIFDFYGEASEVLKQIEAKENVANSVQITARKDPMYFEETIFPTEKRQEVKKQQKVSYDAPSVKIDGIYWDPSTPVVVIDGKALKEKEEYNGVTIDKINEGSVSVVWKGRKFTLKK